MKTKRPEEHVAVAAPHINVTPLIDVLLVLLIIFLVITPLRPSRFKALVPQPPRPDIDEIQPNVATLVVTIRHDLSLQLNRLEDAMGSVNDTTKLRETLSDLFAARERAQPSLPYLSANGAGQRVEKTVMIRAPRSLKYGDVARVIDGIKGAGAEPIGLQLDDLTQ